MVEVGVSETWGCLGKQSGLGRDGLPNGLSVG
jgi:hypothetical protein